MQQELHLSGGYVGVDDDGGVELVKLVKLSTLSILGIVLIHQLARWMYQRNSGVWHGPNSRMPICFLSEHKFGVRVYAMLQGRVGKRDGIK